MYMSQRLPDPDITLTSCSPNVREAYLRVFNAQELGEKAQEQRNARIVGYLLIYLHQFKHTLGEKPISYLVEEICCLTNDRAVFALGEHYLQLFVAFRRRKPTPNPSTRPSRPSFDDQREELVEHLVGPKKDHKMSKNLLMRLGRRFSAMDFDVSRPRHLRWIAVYHMMDNSYVEPDAATFLVLEMSRIVRRTNPRLERAGGVLSILKAFGISMSDTLLQDNGVHDLRNILTLYTACHEVFDALDMCFEPTEVKHQYRIHHLLPTLMSLQTHKIVTFKINDAIVEGSSSCIKIMKENPDQFLPDPKLLALHATCARVAHMSGVAKVLNEWDRDLDEKKVLAADGSDMDMFKYALMGLVQVGVN
ncbi:hypothetical protein VNI00_006171 [Paramarasmius palmivorus]|uniref:HNH nuclease domain-containing protein n=1 Tax=Paramarasmius palmivorus TaxID=297713 RepID=A0AAW0D5L2_9AGAR